MVPKIQSCPFCLKIGTHVISRMLIRIPTLAFWNSDLKTHFWANLGQKSQSCLFCLKIGTHGISRKLILILTLVFWISNQKSILGQIWTKKSQSCPFCLKIDTHAISRMPILIPKLVIWIFKTQIYFWAELVPGSEIACFVWCSYTTYLKGADLFYLKSVTGIITKQVCKCWQNSSKVSNESKKLSF